MRKIALASVVLMGVSILVIVARDVVANYCGIPAWFVAFVALHLAGGSFAIFALALLSLASR